MWSYSHKAIHSFKVVPWDTRAVLGKLLTHGHTLDAASITKLFKSLAMLQLIDQSLFDFKPSLIDFLKLKGTISNKANVYYFLTHISGIGDVTEEEAGKVYEDLRKTNPNYAVVTTADLLPQFIHLPAYFLPGKEFCYCNCGFTLINLPG